MSVHLEAGIQYAEAVELEDTSEEEDIDDLHDLLRESHEPSQKDSDILGALEDGYDVKHIDHETIAGFRERVLGLTDEGASKARADLDHLTSAGVSIYHGVGELSHMMTVTTYDAHTGEVTRYWLERSPDTGKTEELSEDDPPAPREDAVAEEPFFHVIDLTPVLDMSVAETVEVHVETVATSTTDVPREETASTSSPETWFSVVPLALIEHSEQVPQATVTPESTPLSADGSSERQILQAGGEQPPLRKQEVSEASEIPVRSVAVETFPQSREPHPFISVPVRARTAERPQGLPKERVTEQTAQTKIEHVRHVRDLAAPKPEVDVDIQKAVHKTAAQPREIPSPPAIQHERSHAFLPQEMPSTSLEAPRAGGTSEHMFSLPDLPSTGRAEQIAPPPNSEATETHNGGSATETVLSAPYRTKEDVSIPSVPLEPSEHAHPLEVHLASFDAWKKTEVESVEERIVLQQDREHPEHTDAPKMPEVAVPHTLVRTETTKIAADPSPRTERNESSSAPIREEIQRQRVSSEKQEFSRQETEQPAGKEHVTPPSLEQPAEKRAAREGSLAPAASPVLRGESFSPKEYVTDIRESAVTPESQVEHQSVLSGMLYEETVSQGRSRRTSDSPSTFSGNEPADTHTEPSVSVPVSERMQRGYRPASTSAQTRRAADDATSLLQQAA